MLSYYIPFITVVWIKMLRCASMAIVFFFFKQLITFM